MNALRMMLALSGTLLLMSCTSEVDREPTMLEALMKHRQLCDASPQTTIRIQNCTGEPIREVGMTCKSAEPVDKRQSYANSWTRETTVEGEPKEIWSEKYPDPLVLESLRVRFDKGARCEYPLNYRCQPGDKVLLVIEVGGRVTVQVQSDAQN